MHSHVVDVAWNTGLMVALATTIGLLATALFRIDAKIEGLGTRLDGKIEGLGARLDTKIDGLGAHLDAKIDSKVDSLGARMDARFDRVEDRLSRVELRLEQHLHTPH